MAVDIGPKIGIDGEREYRDKINNIITQAKTLSSEMKAVTSSFDKNTTAEEKASKQTDILTKQIKVQEERVDLLKDMLQKSADKYGENSNETLKWQQAVNNATTELNQMRNKVETLNDSLGETDEGLENTKDGMKEVGDSTEKAGEKALTFGDIVKANVISDAITNGLEKLKSAVTGIASAFKDLSIESAAYADDVMTNAAITGLSTDTLQELAYMAELVDTDVSTVTGSMTKLTKSMYSAQTGSSSVQQAFASLGIEYANTDGTLRSSEDTFWDIVDALGNMDNETERDALAMTLLGKSAKELNPLIAAGTDTVAALKQEAHDLGYVLSDEQLNALGAVDDSYQRWQRSIEMVKNQIGVALAPAMEALLTQAQEWVAGVDWEEAGKTIGGLFSDIGEAIKNVDLSQLIKDIVEKVKDFVDTVRDMDIKGFMKNISTVINFIAKNGATIAKVIGAVGGAMAALKLANFAKTATTAIKGISTGVKALKLGSLITSVSGVGSAIAGIAGPVAIAVAAIGAITLVVKNWGKISETAKKLWDTATTGIKTAFTNMKDSITQTVGTLKTSVTTKFEEIKTNASTKFESLKTTLTTTVNNIKDNVSNKFNELKTAVTGSTETTKNNASNNFTQMKTSLNGTSDEIKSSTAKKFDDTEKSVSNSMATAKANTLKAFDETKNGIANKGDGIKEAAKGVADKAAEGMKSQNGNAYTWGSDMGDGFASGISSSSGTVGRAASGLAKSAAQYLHFSRPDKGPLREYEEWMPDMIKGLAKGINDNKWMLEDALNSLSTGELAKSESNYNYGGFTINLMVANEATGNQVMNDIETEIASRMLRRKAVFG